MPADYSEPVRLRLQSDLRDAMKAKDRAKVEVLRVLIAAIDNAGAVAPDALAAPGYSQYVVTGGGKTEVERRALTNDDIARIFAAEAAERRASATDLARHGKMEEAGALRESAAFIDAYLSCYPRPL